MIRKASTADLPAIVELQRSVENESAILGYVADSLEEWGKRSLEWTFVATSDGRPVGFIYCAPRLCAGECVFPADSRVLEIIDLVINAEERNQKLGTALISEVQNSAKAKGFTHLRVYSAAKQFDEIVRFYRSCGFVPWYCEMTTKL